MEVSKLLDAFTSRDLKNSSAPAVALVGTGAVVVAGVFFLARSGSKKSKPGVMELGSGGLKSGEIGAAFTGYQKSYGSADRTEITDKETAPSVADTFYNLVTDFYEWGWGQSFHFSPRLPGKDYVASEVAHQARISGLCGMKPGMKVLDAGCGVGGPMRTIACSSGANVTGVTINAYQVERANYHNSKMGIKLCDLVLSDFLSMPFENDHFDAAYAIEATCHSPTLEAVYSEIFRVLKPGGTFVTYEWLVTDKFDATNPNHIKIIDDIVYGNSLPDMRSVPAALEAAKQVGFEVVECTDLALDSGAGYWYDRMAEVASKANVVNKFLVNLFSTLRILPKGVKQVHDMLLDSAAKGLVAGGELGIFTPMHLFVLRKPE